MLLVFKLKNHKRARCVWITGWKFDGKTVELGYREQFRNPKLVMDLPKNKKVLYPRVSHSTSCV